MSIESQVVMFTTIYKIITLFVGLSSLYMGYRLFISGIWGNAGDVDVKFEKTNIVIKNAAPGTFFALLGAAIVCLTIYKGLELNYARESDSTNQTQNQPREKAPQLPEHPPIN